MKKALFPTLFLFLILGVSGLFAQSEGEEIPSECTPGASYGYYGNWDMHVGGCWLPPEPVTCAYCEYD